MNDPFGRFGKGFPPDNNADWGWLQHILASLKDNGRAAIVLGNAAVTRPKKEKAIRAKFVEEDLIEAVILLPEDLFYNTDSAGIVLILNKNKRYKNEIILINASEEVKESKPKNFLSDEGLEKIIQAYTSWENVDYFSKIVTFDEIKSFDFNLRPSKYVYRKVRREVLRWDYIVEDYQTLLSEASKSIDSVNKVINSIGQECIESTHMGRWSIPQHWQLKEMGRLVEEFEERAGRREFQILSCSKLLGVVLQKEKFSSRIASQNTHKYKVVHPRMFVYDPMLLWDGSIGCNNYDFPGIVSPAYSVFKLADESIDLGYLEHILRSPFLIPDYIAISDGTNRRRRKARFEDFLSIAIPIPSLDEQLTISHLVHNAELFKKLGSNAQELLRAFIYKMFPET